MDIDTLIIPISYLGVLAGAVSGVFEARRKNMDVVGASVIALITALGGGTLRDLMLGRTPVFWINEESFAITAFVTAIITFYSSRLLILGANSIALPDALGLGVFSILGAAYSLDMGTSWFIASLMGVTTGVFGGILRDIICNEIPMVFARNAELYATCSFIGAWVYIILRTGGFHPSFATLAGVSITVLLRLAALRFDLRLPEPQE